VTKNPKTKRLLINLLIILFLAVGTIVAVQFAKGYRPNLQNGSLQGTGLLSVTSYPKSARVNINDKLTTVTDDKLYLTPGNYSVKIEKDGFHPWTKNVLIKSELVTSADARLFPIIPATSPLTFYQVRNATTSPDGTRIAYVLKDAPQETGTERITSAYLLTTKSMNSRNTPDVTVRLPLIINEWQDQYAKINTPTLTLYPKYLSEILTKQATNVYFSPDKEKVFYTSTTTISLPENEIGKTLPNTNSTPEDRNLVKDQTYLFDLKEGTNYRLNFASNSSEIKKTLITTASATPSANLSDLLQLKAQSESFLTTNITWYSNSHQLIVTNTDGVNFVDYDGLNATNITSLQPLNGFTASSPDGSKLILLTNINQRPDTYNLITFDLR
jgi:hypothetical protein